MDLGSIPKPELNGFFRRAVAEVIRRIICDPDVADGPGYFRHGNYQLVGYQISDEALGCVFRTDG